MDGPRIPDGEMPRNFEVPRNLGIRTDIPSMLDEQLRMQHHLSIGVQRDLLVRRGFPLSHPLVSGEIPIHPELLGHLHFDVPSRTTLPLNPEDYRRFLPEMQRSGMQSAFPLSTSDLIALQQQEDRATKVKRQKSHKETTSFSSLQHDEMKKKYNKSRSQSTEGKRFRPFSMFQSGGGGWFSQGQGVKEEKQHWYMKEKSNLQSLPPLPSTNSANTDPNISRDDKNRSSFGMILKDKFQKNPNMYFPDTRPNSSSPEYKTRRERKGEERSDTDTLIHNMSEGSFDKDSSLSGGRSIGSSKSTRSSGKSSLSHDSINGTPEMKRRTESITTPKGPNTTAVHLASNPSIILNKKTIRNYTPKESSNMLRQFEDGRMEEGWNSASSRKDKRSSDGSPIQRKSSMDKLIEDFHRNLPPPPAKDMETASRFSDVDSLFSGSQLDANPIQHQKNSNSNHPKTGTVTSNTSNWSVASSAASFDYHMVTNGDRKSNLKSKDSSASKKRMSQSTTNLPAVCEVEPVMREERIPPEGAAADSPKQFVQRIEVKGTLSKKTSSAEKKPKPPRKTGKEAAKEEVKDLLEPAGEDDDLGLLKKLISEGRISGLNLECRMY